MRKRDHAGADRFQALMRNSVPLPVGEWGRVFGDDVVATAILDRLLHHSHVITIRGESYRLREKRRSGLFRGSSSILFSSAERTTRNQPKETP